MKLLAMTGGRRNGNTETLTKEALMRAEEMGIDVELLRMEVAQALGPDREQIPEKLVKYKAYKKCIVKPPKKIQQQSKAL